MDNQFGRPTYSPSATINPSSSPDNTSQPPLQNLSGGNGDDKKRGGKKKFLKSLLMLLLLAGAAGGVYFWQNSEVKDLNKTLSSAKSQLATAQAEANSLKESQKKLEADAKKNSAAAVNPDLIPGQAETNRTDGRILITAVYKPANAPDEIWIEYGLAPDKLDKSTTHANKNLGAGTDTYAFGQVLEIPKDSVEKGKSYFYRVSAKYKDKTEHGPVASFTTAK